MPKYILQYLRYAAMRTEQTSVGKLTTYEIRDRGLRMHSGGRHGYY